MCMSDRQCDQVQVSSQRDVQRPHTSLRRMVYSIPHGCLLTAMCHAHSALQHRQMDILKPLGLAPEDVKLPLSPRSEDAYARINEEFDMLYSQLQDPGEQAGQNHAEVCMLSPAVNTMPGYAKLAATVQLLRIQPVYISTMSCQLMPQYCALVSFPWPCCCVTFKCALHRRQTTNHTAMHPSTVSGLKACKHVPQVSGVTLVVNPATPHCSDCRMKLWCCSQKHAA